MFALNLSIIIRINTIANNSQGTSTLCLIFLLCLPPFRKLSYELFLRAHQALAVLFIYSIWQHLPSSTIFPRFHLFVIVALFGSAVVVQGIIFTCCAFRHGQVPKYYLRAEGYKLKSDFKTQCKLSQASISICGFPPLAFGPSRRVTPS